MAPQVVGTTTYRTASDDKVGIMKSFFFSSPDDRMHRFHMNHDAIAGLILGLRTANARRRYKVTPPLLAWRKPRFSSVLEA